jgi:hypothetical protein
MLTCIRLILVLCIATIAVSSLQLWPSSFDQSAASSYLNQTLTLSSARGTVGSTVGIALAHYPPDRMVQIRWNGESVGSVPVDDLGVGAMSLKVPAAPMGKHVIEARDDTCSALTSNFEIVPRIRVTAVASTLGAIADVSLRGYALKTLVRIRWLRDTT